MEDIEILRTLEPSDLNIKKQEIFESYSICSDVNNVKIFMKSIYVYIPKNNDSDEKNRNILGWNEVYLLKMLSKDNFPHVMSLYSYHTDYETDDCPTFNGHPCQYKLNILTYYLEGYENFYGFMKRKSANITNTYMETILFTLLYSVLYLQKNNIVHGDLHWDNIMIRRSNKDCRYLLYGLDNEDYYIHNIQYDIKIIDLGLSFQPGIFQYDGINDILDFRHVPINKFDIERILSFLPRFNNDLYYDIKIKLDHNNDIKDFFRKTFYRFKEKRSKKNTLYMYRI